MIRKNILETINMFILITKKRRGSGANNTISISNTIKIIARRKNRKENGIRALLFGSNPHSNGEDFSRFIDLRRDKIHAMKYTIMGIMTATKKEIVIRVIS